MVKHLPPIVKQLLTLRNPQPFSSPSTQKLNAILHKTLGEAKSHNAEDGWLVLSVSRPVCFRKRSSLRRYADFVCDVHK